jgi:SAM-dependent methyltransferase
MQESEDSHRTLNEPVFEGSILSRLDTRTISEMARKESRNREVHLPPLSTFRWWARRTGAVNSGVLEAAEKALITKKQLSVADPFAGGGTIPLVSILRGHRVRAQDINTWAASGIHQMMSSIDSQSLLAAIDTLESRLEPTLHEAYNTVGAEQESATMMHLFRVAVGSCTSCGERERIFPYSLLTQIYRRESERREAFLACRAGHVFFSDGQRGDWCDVCKVKVDRAEIFIPGRIVRCGTCGHTESVSERLLDKQAGWEPVLVEKVGKDGRFFEVPNSLDIDAANRTWPVVMPSNPIPRGSETAVLLRHGYTNWRDLYPSRQAHVTEQLLFAIEGEYGKSDLAAALKLAAIGTAEFAGFLCRWDRYYLKLNDATAGHRFNFSTFVPEFNVFGYEKKGRGTFRRRVVALAKSKRWMEEKGIRPIQVSQDSRDWSEGADLVVTAGDSAHLDGVRESSIDLVLTDPPYHDDVHYSELSLLFRDWTGLSMESIEGEAATNKASGLNRSSEEYSNSLYRVLLECRRVLNPDGRLIFSYANREISAWESLFGALGRAGFHPIGCALVHSENETDFKKRGVKSEIEDLLLELSPTPKNTTPEFHGHTSPNLFMAQVIAQFLELQAVAGPL